MSGFGGFSFSRSSLPALARRLSSSAFVASQRASTAAARVAVLRADDAHARACASSPRARASLVDGERRDRTARAPSRARRPSPRPRPRRATTTAASACRTTRRPGRTGPRRARPARGACAIASRRSGSSSSSLSSARDGVGVLAERDGDARAREAHLGLVLLAGRQRARSPPRPPSKRSARIASVHGSATRHAPTVASIGVDRRRRSGVVGAVAASTRRGVAARAVRTGGIALRAAARSTPASDSGTSVFGVRQRRDTEAASAREADGRRDAGRVLAGDDATRGAARRAS